MLFPASARHFYSRAIRLTLTCAALWWGAAATAAEASHDHTHAASEAPATQPADAPNPGSSVPPEVNQSLRDRQEILNNPNILSSPTSDAHKFKAQQASHVLEIARQQRQRQELAYAKTNLVELVTGDTPADIKRSAMLELALLAQDEGDLLRAQQIFSQFVSKNPDDPSVPEVLLRQGLLYRQMGAYTSALSKLYAVMGKSLNIESDRLEYYQHLVLQAKTEIADTYFAQGNFEDAADYFSRLLKLDEPTLNRAAIRAKLVRCLAHTDRNSELVTQADLMLQEAPASPSAPEIRYEYAKALRRLGRNDEALAQIFLLLQRQESIADQKPNDWDFWRLRVGNDLANQMYADGDYLGALQIYQRLADLNPSPAWQVPVLYQIGLAFERLKQPPKAVEAFSKVIEAGKTLPKAEASQNLTTIIEMATWRRQHLEWSDKTEATTKDLVASTLKPKDGSTTAPSK